LVLDIEALQSANVAGSAVNAVDPRTWQDSFMQADTTT
jgi:hypothetical protein